MGPCFFGCPDTSSPCLLHPACDARPHTKEMTKMLRRAAQTVVVYQTRINVLKYAYHRFYSHCRDSKVLPGGRERVERGRSDLSRRSTTFLPGPIPSETRGSVCVVCAGRCAQASRVVATHSIRRISVKRGSVEGCPVRANRIGSYPAEALPLQFNPKETDQAIFRCVGHHLFTT